MLLIVAIVVLAVLRYLEIGPVASLSWWWIGGLFGLTFIWFEFGEKLLGLDRGKSHDAAEKAKRERIKKSFK
ncbi:MAG: family Trp-rich protein [Paucimonas sp.]|nr:family Trp-rich protein [Paucimonas sp.]